MIQHFSSKASEFIQFSFCIQIFRKLNERMGLMKNPMKNPMKILANWTILDNQDFWFEDLFEDFFEDIHSIQ